MKLPFPMLLLWNLFDFQYHSFKYNQTEEQNMIVMLHILWMYQVP